MAIMLLEIILLLGGAWLISSIINGVSQPNADLPRVGTNPGPFGLRTWWTRWKWYKDGHHNVIQTYKKDKDKNYVTQTLMGDTIVLAPKFLSELNMLPESKLSSTAALVDSVMGQYNGVDMLLKDHLTSDICRGPLTRNLSSFVPLMAEELSAAIESEFGHSSSPKAYTAYPLLLSIIHNISSRVFVGTTYCDSPIWNNAVKQLPIDVEITKYILLPVPRFLRRFIAPLIPARNRIFRERAAVRDLLFPSKGKLEISDEPSVMRLILESGKDKDPESVTARLLLLTAAALHTSSMALTHVIYDLCAMPEYIEPLEAEAEAALAETNGEWTLETIKKLRKLDSFLKESQRHNQSTFLGFDRKVTSPITLSDNTILPLSSTISLPSHPMSLDSTYYTNPNSFSGFRFFRPDNESSNTQQDYTGIEPGNLSWGSGRFTCPGRWYAAVMIKLIMARLLMEYDFEFLGGGKERPGNGWYATEVLPDMEQKIVLRKREL